MKTQKQLNSFLTDLQIRILIAHHSVLDKSWAKQEIVPGFDKLYLICEGHAWIDLDGKKIFMEPGQALLIPSGFTQSYAVIGSEPLVKYWCHFKTNIDLLSLFRLYGLPFVIDHIPLNDWEKPFQQIVAYTKEEAAPAAPLISKSNLYHLLSLYLDRAIAVGTREDASGALPQLKQVIDYIDVHLARSISVQELADSIHLHPNYFIPFFKKYVGTTPMRYIYRRRCEEARKHLLNTNKTLTQIAQVTGFNDVYHLSKAFKKSFELTPTQFKKEHGL